MSASRTAPGPRNLITDVPGLFVGNAFDAGLRSGVTVLLGEEDFVAAVDVRGGAVGSRDLELLDPAATVDKVQALCLSGGSAFGLDAAGGVMASLAGEGRGFRFLDALVPVVPTAILFDLLNGGDKDWGRSPPYFELGRAAAGSAGRDFVLGNAGAGYGALAGDLKGGLGSASLLLEDGTALGALVAVNSYGSPVVSGSASFWAWPYLIGEEAGAEGPPKQASALDALPPAKTAPGRNTTLAIVATDLALNKAEARRLAVMAQDGLARAIRPVHTGYDGDLVFAVSTERRAHGGSMETLTRIGMLAADCLARAVARAMYEAADLGTAICYRSRFGQMPKTPI